MTTVERPHLGWHTMGWGALRRWWVHREEHKTGRYNDDHWWEHRSEFEEDEEEEQPERIAPEVGESTPEEPLSRWEALAAPVKTTALWIVGALVFVLLFSPAPVLLALLLGLAGAALSIQHGRHQRTVDALAEQIEEERRALATKLERAERKEQNRAAHEAERAALYEAKQAEREARRAANREANRGSEAP